MQCCNASQKTGSRDSPSLEQPTPILIIDDHPVFRCGLTALVANQADFEVCGEAGSLSEAIDRFQETQPQAVITDISLPDGSGVDLVKQLINLDPEVRILVCSMHEETLFAERVLRAGAKGYINKEQSPEQIIAAIHCVVQNRVYLSNRMTERLLAQRVGFNQNRDSCSIETLSNRELEVYEQIGHGQTTRQIADRLELSPKTVESYREQIKAKLNLANAAELTQHAVQWVLEQK